jgi:hypothetical protein
MHAATTSSVREIPVPVLRRTRNGFETADGFVPRVGTIRCSCVLCGESVTVRIRAHHHDRVVALLVRWKQPGKHDTFRSTGLYAHTVCVAREFAGRVEAD